MLAVVSVEIGGSLDCPALTARPICATMAERAVMSPWIASTADCWCSRRRVRLRTSRGRRVLISSSATACASAASKSAASSAAAASRSWERVRHGAMSGSVVIRLHGASPNWRTTKGSWWEGFYCRSCDLITSLPAASFYLGGEGGSRSGEKRLVIPIVRTLAGMNM